VQIKVLIIGLFIRSFCLLAQTETDIQLAQHYYLNGEFDKASVYYEKLYEADPSRVNFSRYIDCLNNIKDTKSAEKIYKKQISFNPNDVSLKIQLYSFYKEKEQNEKAKKVRTEISKKEFFEIREIQDVLSNLLSIQEEF
jgi:tetratricopeptide (TPR) repeat protein